MLAVRDVEKAFGGVRALRGVSLDIRAGATTALIGPSGCGKSTLLRILLGLTWPDSGCATFEGEPVAPQNVEQLRRRMGYVIQSGGLFPHLTAFENIVLMARHLRWEAPRIHARVEELLALTHLVRDTLDRYPAELSGGQRQRIGMMRALMLDPDVLLLDEPLGALDVMVRRSLQSQLADMFRQLRKTVVLVTHDLHEAAYLGNAIVLMRRGKIEQAGSMNELLDKPESDFVTRFVNAQRGTADFTGPAAS